MSWSMKCGYALHAVIVALALLTVMSESVAVESKNKKPRKYVALGDSYASSAGQYPLIDMGPCNRSTHNYPSVVAQGLGLERDTTFIDVTCSGATTRDVKETQLDAVTSNTDLVTVTVGGDDGRLFVEAILVCNALGLTDALRIGTPCRDRGGARWPVLSPRGMEENWKQVRRGMNQILEAIQSKAPKAKIIIVNYPRLFTSGVKCGEQGAVTPGDSGWLDSVEQSLNAQLAAAASQHGALLVDAYTQSLGNGICAGTRAWVAGIFPAPGQALPYHPLPAGSEGMARAVLRSLEISTA